MHQPISMLSTVFVVLFFFLNLFIYYLFIYFWLCLVFVSVRGLSLVVASGGHSSSRCAGLSPSWPLLFWSTSSRRAGSVVVTHGLSCSAACGIFPDQGSNSCPLHWQADSQPLRHQGSPVVLSLNGQAIFHQKFPGTGFMTLMPFGQNAESKFLSPPGQSCCGESAGTVFLSPGCQIRLQATASMVLRLDHLSNAGRFLCWGP